MRGDRVWCRLQDLNLQPPYYKYGALPIAPSRQIAQSIGAIARHDAGVGVGLGVDDSLKYASLASVITNCANSAGSSRAPT